MTVFRPYLAYRDSGVEWLGEVPKHWEVRRIKTMASVHSGATPSSTTSAYWDGNISWLTPQDLGALRESRIGKGARNITQAGFDSCGTNLAPQGSVVVSTRAPIGHVGILSKAACTNQGCKLLTIREAIGSVYLFYSLKVARTMLESLGRGTTFPELSRDTLAAFPMCVPPLPEQAAIARFLGDADRRIGRYVSAKKILIGLLEEYRRVLISDAVTGRIDLRTGRPYSAYKDSGVEWLGEVPEHWEVRRIKTMASVHSGATPSSTTSAYWDGNISWLTPQDLGALRESRIGKGARNITQAGFDSCGTNLAPQGSVVVSTRAPIGHVGILSKAACTNQGCKLLTIREAIGSVYLFYSLKVARTMLESLGRGTTFPELSRDTLAAFPMCVPPLPEQAAIARFLGDADRRISMRRKTLERQISLLREYRTRLIADVVTGKLDVREAAAAIPDADPLAGEAARSAPEPSTEI